LADSIREVKQFLKLEEKEKEKLRKQKNKAEQKNFGKTEFLSATVHDLKNHLVAIIGVADLMKNNLNKKYSPEGIKIGKKELSDNIESLDDIGNSAKELSNLHNRVSITVKDHGFGMDEDEIKIALSKYGVIENENSEKVDSTGLGLPIVKYLVEA
jgi:K+-sensing histidine kinase KdpD